LDLSHRVQNLGVDLLNDVKLTNLVENRAKHFSDRNRIQRRAIRGDALHGQTAGIEGCSEPAEQGSDVVVGWVVVKDFVEQTLVHAVVHDGQDAKGAVVQLVNGDVAGEAVQHHLEVVIPDALLTFFPPRPRPSFGPWQRERRRDGRATDANWRRGSASRPQRPNGQRQP
jgi:hypothetical protein